MRRFPYRLIFGFLLWAQACNAASTTAEHPRIWVSAAEQAAVIEKVETAPWAATLFASLRARVDPVVAAHKSDRDAFMRGLPLDWEAAGTGHPPLRYITSDEEDRYVLMRYLQDAIECGVVYYITGETAYAQAAADIMGTVVSALALMERSRNTSNGGLVYPSDHLKEARIFGAQIPVACDFIYPFVTQGANRSYSKVRAPASRNAASAYASALPHTIVIRHHGEAWSNPFAVVFESYTKASQGPAIQSVDSLMEDGVFKGLVVESTTELHSLRHYILTQDVGTDSYHNAALELSFTGHFGVVTTDADGRLLALYIGSGQSLQYRDATLTADHLTQTAFRDFAPSRDTWVNDPAIGWIETSEAPFVFSLNFNGWLYQAPDSDSGTWFYRFK